MTTRTTFPLVLIGLVFGSGASAATLGNAATAYSLGNEGTTLVKVADKDDNPASGLNLTFAGGARVSLDDIAYRPATGQMYGYDHESATVYEIDVTTGNAVAVVTNAGVTGNDDLGFDFNNVLDAARIVTAEEDNVVFFPNKTPPTLEKKFDLFYAIGDVNEGQNPNIVMNAYTNAVAMPVTTQQYTIDSDWNALTTLNNNAGDLATIGTLYWNDTLFDLSEDGGFDILSFSEGDNTAFGLFTAMGTQSIFSVPLVADAMGRINLSFVTTVTSAFGTLDGFAVVPMNNPMMTPAPVPLPASLGLLGLGVSAMAALRRRGRAKAA